ncbi:MAG: aromatic acid exporter family protein [Lachnospiraceae bacterium]|nr:aromatic acid exporter family protein [Lachnospiraceae bacterium]
MKREEKVWKWKRHLVFGFRLMISSVAAILIADLLNLQFESSAGIIALLTIFGTKWATVKLAVNRLLSFGVTVVLCWLTFGKMENRLAAYGIFLLVLVVVSSAADWKSTISVNAVIGTHFMTTHNFEPGAVLNEFLLVVIGIAVAMTINQFHNYRGNRAQLDRDLREIENSLQRILLELADYLMQKEGNGTVWTEIAALEHHLAASRLRAEEYQENTYVSHPGYYIAYIDMRSRQASILHNLHREMRKIRTMPVQAEKIADFLKNTSNYITERNIPKVQLQQLEEMLSDYRKEPLPVTRPEFESRALLYHTLLELEEFLEQKRRFLEGLTDEQKKIYQKES